MSEPSPLPTPALQAWATYGKERFDALDAQLREFRAWARQLITAIGLIVGLELTLVAKITFDVRPTVPVLWWSCLAALLATTIAQVRILFHVLDIGYVSKALPSPGKPSDFWPVITNGEDAIVTEIGIHYATAYNEIRQLSNNLADKLSRQTRHFGYSLAAFCTAVALSGILAFTTARQATTNQRQTMTTDNKPPQSPAKPADTDKSAQPPATTATPTQQSTSPASTMPAPTVPMESQHFAAQPGITPGLPQSHIAPDSIMKAQKSTPIPPPKKKD